MLCEIQHRHTLQGNIGTPVFIRERRGEAKAIWTQRSMVDILNGASEALASSLPSLRGPLYGFTNCQKTLAFGKEYTSTF